ncbi:putative transposase [Gordonia rhizosphera NBRC 16068]|uniref:Putative transposase n=1 Tax=Gordonia rhizosphera NBRC 16068 TaxID=1108045 RepID=K6WI45_9ACTN|nr:putative transposase [Gordonia rhizosphera NBRC 16068]
MPEDRDDKLLKHIHTGLPAGLAKLAQLGRSLWARRAEILAYFDTAASNGPVEASTAASNTPAGSRSDSGTSGTTGTTAVRSLTHAGQLAEHLDAL